MSKAKRRINSTGRERIKREGIDIRILEPASGEPLKAKASIDLSGHDFPSTAAIALEAYHRSSGMRFDCGTVGNVQIPPLLVLDEVDRSGSVLFRVKVIDTQAEPGKILGSALGVQPTSENKEDGQRSLFPVIFRDLGEQTWKVQINYGDRPKLVLNKEIPGISHRLHENPLLQGFLLPAALRIVLEELVRDREPEDDDELGWKSEWLQYCKVGLGIQDDPTELNPDDRADWVERALSRFCNGHGFVRAIRKMEMEAAP
jgi:hypothetical protein